MDLLLGGNCLIGVSRIAGNIRGLVRLDPDMATTETGTDGAVMYSVVPAMGPR